MRASLPLLLLLCAVAALPPTASAQRGPHGKFGVKMARVVKRVYLPPAADADRDGLTNRTEEDHTDTNPRKFDSDGDGFGDGAEVLAGSNPRDRASTPAGPPAPHAAGSPASQTPPPLSTNPPTEKPPLEEPPVEEPPVKEPPIEEPPVEPPPDQTPPNTTIKAGPSGTTESTGATFEFTSTEIGSTFKCSIDAAPPSSCTSPTAYSSLAIGPHTFSVAATDAAGNTDASPAKRNWTVSEPEPPVECTTSLSPTDDVADAVAKAAGGAVICLEPGNYGRLSISGAHKSPMVTVRSGSNGRATVNGISLTDPAGLRFQALDITSGTTVTPSGSNIQFVDNDITGVAGIYMFGDFRIGDSISNVLIEGNNIHDLDYVGNQDTGFGYGIEGVGDVLHATVRDNTIKSTASDYIQSASPVDWVVDHNTFLGPSLLGSHEDHQDLWQIFGGGEDIVFTNNVARNTETQESLLFQEGAFSNVVIENNLFDHDSRGYTCQLYQSSGLIFRDNTIVGSHWGCLFRDLATAAPGSGYEIDHNVFAETEASLDISEEGRADKWGTYDYNVSSDNSAEGANSVRNWSPLWSDTTSYTPLGLPFVAGYRP